MAFLFLTTYPHFSFFCKCFWLMHLHQSCNRSISFQTSMMPRTGADHATAKSSQPENPVETEEKVEIHSNNDMDEEDPEEEVEYEEVEEEVEEEEEEEEVEEEVEEEEEDENDDMRSSHKRSNRDNDMEGDEDTERKHSELLSLPPHGSEVYVGGIPQDTSQGDLKRFCESIGEVTEVRIMKGKDTKENKGYAFVTFRTKELASKAMKELSNAEFKGKKLKCSSSQAKHKLFIGNIPRNWGEADLKKVVNKVGPGVVVVELVKDPHNSSKNRGFAFIEYYNHACAEYSRQKMSDPKFNLDDNAPTVSWADPRNAEASSTSSQVKAVYVKNLPKDVTQDQLQTLFERHGKITKIVLPPAKPGQENSRYGFVHFQDRSSAMKALKNTEKYEIHGQVMECSLAKPQADQKASVGSSASSNTQQPAILPTYPPQPGYGLVGSPYAALGAGFPGPGFAQSMIYGRGATPGVAMMPMLLPDGRIGYVLQQPGLQAHAPPQPPIIQGHHRRGGGRRGRDGGRGRGRGPRYNPY